MSVQTSYPTTRSLGFAGALADSGPSDVKSVIAAVAIAAGLVVITGATPANGYLPTAPDAADVDAFITAGASAATAQTEASRYHDVDAVILSDWLHTPWTGTFDVVFGTNLPASAVPWLAGRPAGYNTTFDGIRARFYNLGNTDPRVVAHDENTRDTGTLAEAAARLGEYAAAGVERIMLRNMCHDDLDAIALMGELQQEVNR